MSASARRGSAGERDVAGRIFLAPCLACFRFPSTVSHPHSETVKETEVSKHQTEQRIRLDTFLVDEDLTGRAPHFFDCCRRLLCEARRRDYQHPVIFALSAKSPQACHLFAAVHGHPLVEEAGNILSGIRHFPFPDEPTAVEVLPASEAGRLLRLHTGVGGQSAANLVEDQSLEHDFWHVHLLNNKIGVTAFSGQRIVWFAAMGYEEQRRVMTPADYDASQINGSVTLDLPSGESVAVRGRSGLELRLALGVVRTLVIGTLEENRGSGWRLVPLTDAVRGARDLGDGRLRDFQLIRDRDGVRPRGKQFPGFPHGFHGRRGHSRDRHGGGCLAVRPGRCFRSPGGRSPAPDGPVVACRLSIFRCWRSG